MVLTLRETPHDSCKRYIVSAHDLFLCRDNKYRCSPKIFAEKFAEFCDSSGNVREGGLLRDSSDLTNSIQSHNSLSEFLLQCTDKIARLNAVPKGLLQSLARAYCTLNYEESELQDVCSYIKTCFSNTDAIDTIVPLHNTCKITGIRYNAPRGKSTTATGDLVIGEQCDFEIRCKDNSTMTIQLGVEYEVSGLETKPELFYIKPRMVSVSERNACAGIANQTTCNWGTAYGDVKRFYVENCSNLECGPVFKKRNTQHQNKDFLSRRVFYKAKKCSDIVEGLLSALLGTPKEQLSLKYGRVVAHSVQGSSKSNNVSHYVRCRVLVDESTDQARGAEVRYKVYKMANKDEVLLSFDTINVTKLCISSDNGNGFLNSTVNFDIIGVLPMNCEVIMQGTSLLIDARKLAVDTPGTIARCRSTFNLSGGTYCFPGKGQPHEWSASHPSSSFSSRRNGHMGHIGYGGSQINVSSSVCGISIACGFQGGRSF